jgi:hypothetical protein
MMMMMMIVIIHKVSSKSPSVFTLGGGGGAVLFSFHLQFFSASSSSRPVSDFHYLNAPSVLTGPGPWIRILSHKWGPGCPCQPGLLGTSAASGRRRYSKFGRTL